MESLQYDGTRYTLTVFEKADGTLAEDLHPADWTDTLFQSIGRAAGRLHRISKGYVPSASSLTRAHWFDSYEIRMALRLLANSRDPARDFLTSLMDELRQLPDRPDEYGMIHDDLHFANFLITPGQQVIIIDYDDCGYGWYAMDVAMALFDVLVLYNPADDITGQVFARRFMLNYLEGYRSENAISLFWQCQIPHFLKLKELCIYPTLIGHPEITQPDTWVGRFMRDRPCRIAANLPYVDLDFSNL
jgi:Ser/Thr protein kinase RdoA (MazF antagonist)